MAWYFLSETRREREFFRVLRKPLNDLQTQIEFSTVVQLESNLKGCGTKFMLTSFIDYEAEKNQT